MQKIPPSDRNPFRFLDKALEKWEQRDARPIFEFREISHSETLTLISSLSDSESFGQDCIDSLSIKSVAGEISGPIRHLINTSLKSRKFAMKWKTAKVTPRLKGRGMDRMDVSSFRPVAVLSTVSKLVERAAQQQLLKFMEETCQLNPSSHAYRQHLSTTTTLAEILDILYQGAEDRKLASVMAIDQSSAFDCIDHQILLKKLQRYNIGTAAVEWIKDYLGHISQYVVIGAGTSRMTALERGVPQGSVLGPLLYAIFTNETSEVVKNPSCNNPVHQSTVSLFGKQCTDCGIVTSYADDTTYSVTSRQRQHNQTRLITTLDELQLFFDDNRLAINVSKTAILECMLKQKRARLGGHPPTLQVEDDTGETKTLEDAQHMRILGANLQGNMLWSSHLETGQKALFPQVRKVLGRLKHQGKLIPISSRNNLARGLILSRLNYLMPLWGGATENLLRKAQVIVNSAARWTTGLGRRTRTTQLMKSTGWLTVKEQVRVSTSVLTWKLLHLGKPARLAEGMQITPDWKIEIELPRLQFSQTCLKWRAASQWNDLPQDLRELPTIAAFKRQVKRQILSERTWDPGD